jgi:hypothetical protein
LVASATAALFLLGGSIAAVRVTEIRSPAADSRDDIIGQGYRDALSTEAQQSALDRYRHLRSLGLTDDDTKPLILAQIRSTERARLSHREFRYWAQDGDAELLQVAADELAALDRIRDALAQIYQRPAEDPVFAQLYRPYDDRLPFLSSQQQLQLQAGRLRFRLAAARGMDMGGERSIEHTPMNARAPGLHPESAPEWRSFLETILDPAALFEYELRESPLAGELRRAGIELSETEFREVHRALATLANDPDTIAYRETRVALRKLLGSQRFDELWAGRDPVYPIVSQLLRARGFPETAIFAAYGVLNRAQDAFVDAAALTVRDPARGVVAASEISANEERQLAGIVGDDIATQILTARAQALFEMGRQSFVTQ